LEAVDGRDRSRAQRVAIHHDRVELNVPVAIQMRAGAGVEDRIVLEHHDRRRYGVDGPAALLEDRPAAIERPLATAAARGHRVLGDVPSAAVNDEGWAIRHAPKMG